MTEPDRWKVQVWLGDLLIEEHRAPTELAQRYADAIRLRIKGLPGHELRCERLSEHELPSPPQRPYDRRD